MVSESDDKRFFEYFKTASETAATVERARGIYESLVACMRFDGVDVSGGLRVADVGCGAGTQGMLWAQAGHRVFGIDINDDLVDLARTRAAQAGLDAMFLKGSADELPWETGAFDVCIVPELLEHVENWERCLDEVCRIVRPGGYLFLTTTNRLCPKQQEFALPGYSWYPSWLKRKCLALARTTRKHWVEYAEYPAVNWFSPPELAGELRKRGYSTLDRFDLIVRRRGSGAAAAVAKAVTSATLFRYMAYLVTPYTMLVGRNDAATPAQRN